MHRCIFRHDVTRRDTRGVHGEHRRSEHRERGVQQLEAGGDVEFPVTLVDILVAGDDVVPYRQCLCGYLGVSDTGFRQSVIRDDTHVRAYPGNEDDDGFAVIEPHSRADDESVFHFTENGVPFSEVDDGTLQVLQQVISVLLRRINDHNQNYSTEIVKLMPN